MSRRRAPARRRRGALDDQRDLAEDQSRLRDEEQALQAGLQQAANTDAAVDPFAGLEDGEVLDKLTELGIESDEFGDLEAMLKPFLSTSDMLANHGDDFYDDLSRELLGENLADRVTRFRSYPALCTGPFRVVAQEVDGDPYPGERSDISDLQREAIREVLGKVKVNRESLGDGTFLDALTKIHTSNEVSRPEGDGSGKKGGLFSFIPGVGR